MEDTWIIVADGAQAGIYRYINPQLGLSLIKKFRHTNAPTHELVSTERGRVFNSADSRRSAMERPTDPHWYEKHLFACELADYLAVSNESIERLVIVAAPKFLGELRSLLPQRIKNKLIAEINKDFTNQPLDELLEKLEEVLPIQAHPRRLSEDVPYAKP